MSTLLDRLVAAYEQGCRIDWEFDDYAPMRATVRCLAKWMANNHSAHSGAYIAQILEHVAGPEEIPAEPHPSLSAQERNPSMQ